MSVILTYCDVSLPELEMRCSVVMCKRVLSCVVYKNFVIEIYCINKASAFVFSWSNNLYSSKFYCILQCTWVMWRLWL